MLWRRNHVSCTYMQDCAILSVLCSFVTLNNPWPESSKLSFYSPWATTDRFTISFAFQLCCLLRPLTIFTRGSFDDIFIQQKFKTMFLSYNKVFLQHYCQWAQQWDCLYYRHDPKNLSRLELHLIMSDSSHFWGRSNHFYSQRFVWQSDKIFHGFFLQSSVKVLNCRIYIAAYLWHYKAKSP